MEDGAQILEVVAVGVDHLGLELPQSHDKDALQEHDHSVQQIQTDVCLGLKC